MLKLIDITDLYHPHQDVGDNFDLIMPYALPDVDLLLVVVRHHFYCKELSHNNE